MDPQGQNGTASPAAWPHDLRLAVLGSGSSGNCTYVEADGYGLLIDAGLSAKATKERLAALDIPFSRVRGVCVTHEHKDHTRGIPQLHKQLGIDLFANFGTAQIVDPTLPWLYFQTGCAFGAGPFAVTPFNLPHDAMDPVGFLLEYGGVRIGFATDLGMPTTLVRTVLRTCTALVLESNHEVSLLRASSRPPRTIQRILSRQGHLSNDTAADLLAEIAAADHALQHVFAAHLSHECNRCELALDALRRAVARVGRPDILVHPTFPDHPSDLLAFS